MNIPAIDVLRGVAALGVTWFHSRVDLWVGFREINANPDGYSPIDRWLSLLSLPVSQLGSLVMLFFVLSGFCIHLPLAGKSRDPDLASYAIRRGFRIYPAYFAVLVFCYFSAMILALSLGTASVTGSERTKYAVSALMLQNWVYDGGQIAMNPSLWSIPVEVELYFVYPILVWIHLRFGMAASFAFTLACTGIGWALHFSGAAIALGSFFKYAIIWNSGAWLAEHYVRQTLPKFTRWHLALLVLSLMLTPALGLRGVDVFYLHYGWGVASFLGLWWLITDGARFIPPNDWWVRWLAALGTISYSLYLIHFPMFKIGGIFWIEIFQSKPSSFLVPSLATLMVIPFAWVFYRLFEYPSHEIGRTIAKRIQKLPNKETAVP